MPPKNSGKSAAKTANLRLSAKLGKKVPPIVNYDAMISNERRKASTNRSLDPPPPASKRAKASDKAEMKVDTTAQFKQPREAQVKAQAKK